MALESSAKVSATLLDMKRFELSAEAFDVELQLAKLHLKLMQAAGKPRQSTPPENAPDAPDENLPF